MAALKTYKGIELENTSMHYRISAAKPFSRPYRKEDFRSSPKAALFYRVANCSHINNDWIEARDIKYAIDEAIKGNNAYKWIGEHIQK